MAFTSDDKRESMNELRGLSILMMQRCNPDGSRTLSAQQLQLVVGLMGKAANIIEENLSVLPRGESLGYKGVYVKLEGTK